MGKNKKFCEVCLTETNSVSKKEIDNTKESSKVITGRTNTSANTSLSAFAIGLSIISIFATLYLMSTINQRFDENERAIIYMAENFRNDPSTIEPDLDSGDFYDNCMGLDFNSNFPDAGICELVNAQDEDRYISPLGTQNSDSMGGCALGSPELPANGFMGGSYDNSNMNPVDGSTATTSMPAIVTPQMQRYHDTLTPEQLKAMYKMHSDSLAICTR
jgi:hypothetical protein